METNEIHKRSLIKNFKKIELKCITSGEVKWTNATHTPDSVIIYGEYDYTREREMRERKGQEKKRKKNEFICDVDTFDNDSHTEDNSSLR